MIYNVGNFHLTVSAESLPAIVETADLGLRYRVTDVDEFARSLGKVWDVEMTTKMVVLAIAEAIDQGAQGIEEVVDEH